jgi:hypothetical protein
VSGCEEMAGGVPLYRVPSSDRSTVAPACDDRRVNVLFEDRFRVEYAQAYVVSGGFDLPDPILAFHGQVNGLCGAALPGDLFLVTGLHSGVVHLRVELAEREPELTDWWEEAVEASFTPGADDVALVQWASEASFPLALPVQKYRVRYCARGMDAAREPAVVAHLADPVDSYLLTFWPSPPGPDRILRETSSIAIYWHNERGSPG